MFDDIDRILMWTVFIVLVVVGILGVTRHLDLDDAQLRYPSVPPTTFQINPAYNHPEQP